jgi:hypothetical protein
LDFEAFFPVEEEIWLWEPMDCLLPNELVPILISGIPWFEKLC